MNRCVRGQLVDIHQRSIYPAVINISDKRIASIEKVDDAPQVYILPGFVDAHIHIESSMLVPYEFARIALKYGTVATVSDPHEIANVLGVDGVLYMIENAQNAKLKFHFGVPSCVPATTFETAGAKMDAEDINQLLKRKDIHYLSEMMNYPGVIHEDPEVMQKIEYAKAMGKVIDGHAPGLRGDQARQYIEAGISTDHECFTLEEAIEKLVYGMKIIIREGSAAKNFGALHPLIKTHPDRVMFCSDDKHPDDLLQGHIDQLIKRALDLGYDLFDVLRIASLNPVNHYTLAVGLLREDDPADFIVVEDLDDFKVRETYIDGLPIFSANVVQLPEKVHHVVNQFSVSNKSIDEFEYEGPFVEVPIIQAIDGEIITQKKIADLQINDEGKIEGSIPDILKIAVVNRYTDAEIKVGFVQGFGLREGAISSSVAHDSHNIIVVGADDKSMCQAVNLLIQNKGGLSVVGENIEEVLPLPIAGLMSTQDGHTVANKYQILDQATKDLGSTLTAPFMTLSFMALLVIPEIKMSDKGLFDAEHFRFYRAFQ